MSANAKQKQHNMLILQSSTVFLSNTLLCCYDAMLFLPIVVTMCRPDSNYEAYVASNVQYQASTDPEYQALLTQRQQLQDPEAEAAMVSLGSR